MRQFPEDQELLKAARKGEPEAIACLYNRYAAEVFQLALSVVQSEADAEDVLHNIFLALPESLHTYNGTGPLEAWLSKVTSRAALMFLRSKTSRREAPLDQFPNELRSSAPPIEEMMTFEVAIGTLPEYERLVIILREIEGLSYKEIAELLKCSEGASRTRHTRAMNRLRAWLKERA